MTFDWDEDKATRNLAEHGVAFDEAITASANPLFIDFFDPEYSEDEHHYIRVGRSDRGRVLVVSHPERNDLTRLVSARSATKSEQQAYEED